MMRKIQRFGGAMFLPALLFAFSGIIVGFSIIFQNEAIMGPMASMDHWWGQLWSVISAGAWTVFMQLPLLFSIAIPISLAKKQPARATLAALTSYLTFNYFINQMLTVWGGTFGVDIMAEVGVDSGLAMIGSIKTLDTGMLGALMISGLVTWVHNKFYDKELPEYIGTFRGTPTVVAISFFLMLPVAFLTCMIWPFIQDLMREMQTFFVNSGNFGIWVYGFLQKILIPTGLHHFVYAPITYDSLVVPGGTSVYWATHLPDFQTSAQTLKEMYPIGFSLSGLAKVFGSIGVFGAFYVTAKPEKRKKVLGLMIPATLTAVLTGITEPLEFTFLFIAPVLFFVHALLDATLQTVAFALGVVGDFGGGIINWVVLNWLPLGYYHYATYIIQVVIGLIFSVIWFVTFTYLIRKYNFLTPGRELDDDEVKLYSKNEYLERKGNNVDSLNSATSDVTKEESQAREYLALLGGKENISEVTNCATRLRLIVNDSKKVAPESAFKEAGAHGLVHNGQAVQVIVGLSVPYVRDAFEELINN